MKKYLIIFSLLGLIITSASGQIQSKWRGPNRDGFYPNENLMKKWPDDGPRLLWYNDEIGEGFSSAAVTSLRVYITDMVENIGCLFTFNKQNCKLTWKTPYGPEWTRSLHGSYPGVRTTPAVVGEHIYIMSAEGVAVCLNKNGNILCSVDLIKEYDARNVNYGMTESLLVDGDRVFYTTSGADIMMVALNWHTGNKIWMINGNGQYSAYCSPVIVTHGNLLINLALY